MAFGVFGGSSTGNVISNPISVNPGDLIVLQIAQTGGTAGTVSDSFNNYTLYSSNETTQTPQSYNFYSQATYPLPQGTTITYTPNGSSSNVSLSIIVVRVNSGEKLFNTPIVYTSNTGVNPSTSLNNTISNVVAPAIVIGTTVLSNKDYAQVTQDSAGNSNWSSGYYDINSGLSSYIKITKSNSNISYNTTFGSTTGFQTLLTIPLVLDLSSTSSTSGGLISTGINTLIQAGSTSFASEAFSLITKIKSSINANVDLDNAIFNNIGLVASVNSNTNANISFLSSPARIAPYNLSLLAGGVTNGNINLKAQSTILPYISGQVSSDADIATSSIMTLQPTRAFVLSGAYLDLTYSPILTDNLTLNAIANSNAKDKINFQTNLIQAINTEVNAFDKINFRTNINQSTNTQISGQIYLDPITIFVKSSAGVNSNAYFDLTTTILNPLSVYSNAVAKSNAFDKINFISSLSQVINTQSVTLEKINFQTNIKQSVNVESNGLSLDNTSFITTYTPTFTKINLILSASIKSNAFFDLSIPISSPIVISSNAFGLSDAFDKINFQTNINQTINTQANAFDKINFQTNIKQSTNSQVYGFAKPDPSSLLIKSNAFNISNGYADTTSIVFTQTLTSNIIANSNARDKFNFQTNLIQSINTEANAFDKINFQTNINQSTNITSDSDISSLLNITLSNRASSVVLANIILNVTPTDMVLNLFAKSNGYEKLDLVIPVSSPNLLSVSAATITNAKETFNFKSFVSQQIQSQSNSIEALNLNIPIIKIYGIQSSSGYINPLIGSITTNYLSLNLFGNSGAKEALSLVKPVVDLILNLIADTNAKEYFNFKSNLYQTINSQTNSFDKISFQSNLKQSINVLSNSYIDTTAVSLSNMGISAIGGMSSAAGYVSQNIYYPYSNLTAQSNAFDKINFRTNIVQSINAQANLYNNVVAPIGLKLYANMESNGYIDPTLASINTLLVSSNIATSSSGTLPVSLTITYVPNLIANANAFDKINFRTNINQTINTETNAFDKINFQTNIKQAVNTQSTAQSYLDPITIFINSLAGANSSAYFNLVSPILSPLLMSSNTFTLSNAFEKINFRTNISQAINSEANAFDKIIFQTNIKQSINTSTLAQLYIDPTTIFISSLAATSSNAYFNLTPSILSPLFISSNAFVLSNAFDKINFRTNISQAINTQVNAYGNIISSIGLKSYANMTSSGYIDPALSSTNTLLASSNTAVSSSGLFPASLTITYSPNLIANSNAFDKINFKTNIAQSVNTISDANSSPLFITKIVSTAGGAVNGYLNPLVSSIATINFNSNAFGQSGALEQFSLIKPILDPSLTLNLIASPNARINPTTTYFIPTQGQASVNSLINLAAQKMTITSQAQVQSYGLIDFASVSINSLNSRSNATANSGAFFAGSFVTSPIINLITQSNARDKFNFQTNITQSINSSINGVINTSSVGFINKLSLTANTNGYLDPTLLPIFNSNISASLFAKSGGNGVGLSLPIVSTPAVQPIYGNIIIDPSFELGGLNWYGINNYVNPTTAYAYSGTQSLAITTLNTYGVADEYIGGPLGAYQTFKAIDGVIYTLSAYVKNISGSTPRDMYAAIVWSNGVVYRGQVSSVGSSDGWVQLSVSGTAPSSGTATAVIYTSTPLDSQAGDSAVIDNVSLVADNTKLPAAPILGLVSTVNGSIGISVSSYLSLQSETNVFGTINPSSQTYPIKSQVFAEANGFIDPIVYQVNIPLIASAFAKSNALIITNQQTSATAFTRSAAFDKINFQTNIIQSVNTFVNLNLNPVTTISLKSTGLGSLSNATINIDPVTIFIKSSLSASTNAFIVTTKEISGIASGKPAAFDKINFQSNLIQSINSASTTIDKINFQTNIKQSINVATNGDALAITNIVTPILSISGNLIAISGGAASPGLVITTFNQLQPVNNQGNIFPNSYFESGTSGWTGIQNPIAVTTDYSYEGLNSLIISRPDYYDPDYLGPIGAKADFVVEGKRVYAASVQVRNVGGSTPRTMSATILWPDGGMTTTSRLVDINDGWVTLTLGKESFIAGSATIFVTISSTIFDFVSDIGVIDSVIVNSVDKPAIFAPSIIANSNAKDKFTLQSNIIQSINSKANSFDKINFQSNIKQAINTQVYGLINPEPSLLLIKSNLFAASSGYADTTSWIFNQAFASDIIAKSNARDKFNFQSNIIQSINSIANANINLDPLKISSLTQAKINPVFAISDADFISSVTYNLNNINAAVKSGANLDATTSVISTASLTLSAFATSNAREKVSLCIPIKTPTTLISTNSYEQVYINWDMESVWNTQDYASTPDISGWSGISNQISSSDLGVSAYGQYSLIVQDSPSIDVTDGAGLQGARIDFNALPLTDYVFGALVSNISGTDNREMYLEIQWSSGQVSRGLSVYVSQSSAWQLLTLSAKSLAPGKATLYVVTSDPFNSINGDVSAVDNVGIIYKTPNLQQNNLNNPVISNGKIDLSLKHSLSSRINSISIASTNIDGQTLNLKSNIITSSNGYLDATVSSIVLDSLVINAFANTSGNAVIKSNNSVTGVAFTETNSYEKFVTTYKILTQIQVQSNGFADGAIVNNQSLRPIATAMSSSASIGLSLTLSTYADLVANSSGRIIPTQKDVLQPGLIPSANIQNGDFNQGLAYWSGITNGLLVTNSLNADQSPSVIITDNEIGINGITQPFYAYSSYKYDITANVKNLSAVTQNMYIKVVLSDGTTYYGAPASVNNTVSDWAQITFSYVSTVTGPAQLYIITSDVSNEIGEIAAIDSVVFITSFASGDVVPYGTITGTVGFAKSNGFDKINFKSYLVSQIQTTSNVSANIPSIYNIKTTPAIGNVNGYIDFTVAPITTFAPAIVGSGKSGGGIGIQTTSIISGLGTTDINAREAIITTYKINAQIQSTVTATGKIDISGVGLVIKQSAKAQVVSGGDLQNTIIFGPSANGVSNITGTIKPNTIYSIAGVAQVQGLGLASGRFTAPDPGYKIFLEPLSIFATSLGDAKPIAQEGNQLIFIGWGMAL